MTDAGQKLLSIVQKHSEYSLFSSSAQKELDILHEMDSLSSDESLKKYLLNTHSKIKAGELRQGSDNKLNSWLAYLLCLTSKKPDGEFILTKRRTYGRSGFPDIDMDFDYLRRSEVLDYIINKYGKDNVAHIGTVQTLKTKNAVRRAVKVLDPSNSSKYDEKGNLIKGEKNINFALENEILNTLPEIMKKRNGELIKNVDEACKIYSQFGAYMKQYPEVRRIAAAIEGTISSSGCHPAGVVASPVPLSRLCPLHRTRGTDSEMVATQFTAADVERLGLIKFDVLGLKTKTAIHDACKALKENYGIEIDWNTIPLDDKSALDILNSGNTDGCFQFEEQGMKDASQLVKISSFDDIASVIALYRPGPMEYIPEFATRKKGSHKVEYAHSSIKPILESTYGIICFQENTLISMEDGSEKPIKEVKKSDRVHCVDLETKDVRTEECYGCRATRNGPGLKIRLENGYELIVTPEHKLLTYYGMKEAQKLDRKTDLIACPIKTPGRGNENRIASWLGKDIDVAYFLGRITGDGNVSTGCSISCGPENDCDNVQRWLNKKIPNINTYKYQYGSWYLCISCPELINSPQYGNRKTKFHVLLEESGLATNCYHKRIPQSILRHTSDEVKKSYLAGLFDSDGCIKPNSSNGFAICHYTSESPGLIRDLRKLLQSLGLAHQVRRNRIHIWDTSSLRDYIEQYLVVRNFHARLTHGKRCSWIPKQEIFDLKDRDHLSQRKFAEKYSVARGVFRGETNFVCLNTAEKCGIKNGDLRYYRISSIKKVKNNQFYGMSVNKHHNLIANGIVAENCFQEQVMQVFIKMSGLTANDGYKFIKGCAKKIPELIAQYKDIFIKGSLKNGITENIINKVWLDLEKFGGYSFNRSHAYSYAFEAYKTAYLKAHYPTEFIAARLSVETQDRKFDKVDKYTLDAIQNFGFTIVPPDLNLSKLHWTIVGDRKLRQPMLLKGIGPKAAEIIVQGQPYKGNDLFYAFVKKVGPSVGVKTIDTMIDLGIWGEIKSKKQKDKLLKDFEQIKKDCKKGGTDEDIFDL